MLDPISITSALMQDTSSQLGSDLILSVDVTGSGPINYEWSFNEQVISLNDSVIAQEDGSLLMLDIKDENEGLYEVKVSNKLSSASSSTTLNVTEGPRIQYNAKDKVVLAGEGVSFNVVATGSQPLAYQWYFNGNAIIGANESVYSLSSVASSNIGQYYVLLTNPFGETQSIPARLTVNTPLSVKTDLIDLIGVVDGKISMVFDVTGSGPVNYTWFKDGRELDGETNSKLSLSNLSMNDAGDYSVIAENSVNQVVSKSASLVIEVGPSIVQQPQSSRVRKGDGFNLSVLPSGTCLLYTSPSPRDS